MKTLIAFFILCAVVSCTGPVFVAKDANEGIRTSYPDPKLTALSADNHANLRDIYQRYQRAGVDVYPNGIGFTSLSDGQGKKYYYLLVEVRPRDISFGQEQTTPEKRFGEVFERQFEKNLRYLRPQDVQADGIDGLAFGVYWPVRDLSQCDTYGGFLEYAIIYLKKADFIDMINGQMDFSQAAKNAEIVRSLGLQKPDSIRVIETE
ncbi:MAG: hypothetical protein A4E57_04331 [Syntrophorhabdaceae bacterium PtaU1.Bin034]|jgi:hypothetical protein|nr:MAG: hypothetical protein A4E57_04331 [Syntrophorhabdaceae bacterium PtaU1.Bin034]